MEDAALSTFSRDEVKRLEMNGQKVAKVIKVEVVPLPDIINRYAKGVFSAFLSMDVEGFEIEILKANLIAKIYLCIIVYFTYCG